MIVRRILPLLLVVLAAAGGVTAAPQSIAVPAYFYPVYPDPLWTQMQDAAPVVSVAIMNPGSGPGASPDSNYTAQVAATRAAGVKVLGYVTSSYATRDPADVKAEIDEYYLWYGVDGIFIDEADNNCASAPYYSDLDVYTKTKGGLGLTVINPGTVTPECFVTAADVILNFEGSYSQYQSYAPLGWESGYEPGHFWHLVYATAEVDMPSAVLLSQARGAGYVYVTPDTLVPNPWDSLPQGSYWTSELAYVQPTEGACAAPVSKPKLQVRGIFSAEADDSLTFAGGFALAGTPVIDPVANGLRFVVGDATGAKVDIRLPGGGYDDMTSVGWIGGGSKWTYRDDRDPADDGIFKATVKTKTDGVTTTVTFRVFGRDGSYPVSADEIPLTAVLGLLPDEPTESCATASFPGPKPVCVATSSGVRCK
ncbi:MAG TPA: spherulation-specific family 4 protein [Candidatus Limnocylindrales bacterium]|nr:spherulation-specific family 4 protein [Candidatus Limnocylindrales bacterium]